METVKLLLEKYTKGDGPFERFPPGGKNVLALCEMVTKLELLVRSIQRRSTVDIQNEIETRLRQIDEEALKK